jgi:hypothetical protein
MPIDTAGKNPHEIVAITRGCYCDKCPIASGTPAAPTDYGNVASYTRGPAYPVDGIIVVGEIPTFNDKKGPLSGRAKRNWQEALDKSGLASLNLLLVPSVHCVPGVVIKKSDRQRIVSACRPSPNVDLVANPHVPVLLMGTDAIQSYGLDKKITENRGFLHRDSSNGRPYIITFAATTVMFGNIYMWGTFLEDLRRFYRLITNTLKPGLLPSMVKIHADYQDISAFLLKNPNAWAAVDIETTAPNSNPEWGLDATKASLKTIAFGTKDQAVSLCWSHADFRTIKLVADILGEQDFVKVFHNGPWFDLRVLRRYDLEIRAWEDTRDLRRAISSTSRLSLGYLGSLYCDIHAWKLDDNNDKQSTGTNLDELLLYNGYDTIVTARIYEAMKDAIGPGPWVK